jgi:hypothetical protein
MAHAGVGLGQTSTIYNATQSVFLCTSELNYVVSMRILRFQPVSVLNLIVNVPCVGKYIDPPPLIE